MPALVVPNLDYYQSFIDSFQEWNVAEQPGLLVRTSDDLTKPSEFNEWLKFIKNLELGKDLPTGYVTSTHRWIVEDGYYLGSISLRHYLSPWHEKWGGHIGYSVRPSFRNKGVASFALKEILKIASQLELKEVMLVCKTNNIASKKTILSTNGKIISSELDPVKNEMIERYLIRLN